MSNMDLPVAIVGTCMVMSTVLTGMKVSQEYCRLVDLVAHAKSNGYGDGDSSRDGLARCCVVCMGLEIIL